MTINRSPRAPKTAAALMAELREDPAYRARVDAKESARLKNVARDREDAEPVFAALQKAGIDVATFRELHTRKTEIARAVPVLLEWLPVVVNTHVKEAIVRALSVPHARPVAAKTLVDEFRRVDSGATSLRWAIGNALDVVADDSVVDDLINLAKDTRQGKAREMIVLALGNSSDPRVVPVLLELLKDEDVCGHAVSALAKLRPPIARPYLLPFTEHPKAYVRNAAKKALARIDKVVSRAQ